MLSNTTFNSSIKVWSGPKVSPINDPNQTLGKLLLESLKKTPELITQISDDTGNSVTCQQMYNRSMAMIGFFNKHELKNGQIIGFVTKNTENLAPIVFACFTLGLPINPLSPIMNEMDIVQMFSKTQPAMVFCDADILEVVQKAMDKVNKSTKVVTVMEKIDGYECATDFIDNRKVGVNLDFQFPDIDPNSTAAILCSSGSTGFPKGICKSHKQIITHFFPLWPMTGDKVHVFFQGSPIFWLSGFYTLVASALYGCTRVSTVQPLNAEILNKIIQKFKVSLIITPPYLLLSLIQLENVEPLSSLNYVYVGGSVVSENIIINAKERIPNGSVVQIYGSTEQDFIAFNYTGEKLNSTGLVFQNVKVMIIDDDLSPLGPNQRGEICSKLSVQFNGYFGEPEETSKAFYGDWFKSGDIGYFDDEGFLYILDRKKQLLKYNNYQVTPSEIEAILNEIEGVVSSCVVGVPEIETGNDILHALVTVSLQSDLNEKSILDYVNGKVIDQKKIRGGVRIVESLPVGLTGKVDRSKAKNMLLKN